MASCSLDISRLNTATGILKFMAVCCAMSGRRRSFPAGAAPMIMRSPAGNPMSVHQLLEPCRDAGYRLFLSYSCSIILKVSFYNVLHVEKEVFVLWSEISKMASPRNPQLVRVGAVLVNLGGDIGRRLMRDPEQRLLGTIAHDGVYLRK